MVARLDRLARSTRDLLNILATIADKGAGFRSIGDTWADTTTPHGRLMLTVLGGFAEFERELTKARTGVVSGLRLAASSSDGRLSSTLTSGAKPLSVLRLARRKPTSHERTTSIR